MFKRLLFGNEAKLQFKTSTTNGIARLYSEAHIPKDDLQYWRKFLQTFDSSNDVFTLISISDIRRALVRNPENVINLITILISHLEILRDDPEFSPLPVQTGKSPSIGGAASKSTIRVSEQASSSAIYLVDAGARSAAALGSLLGGQSNTSNTSQNQSQRIVGEGSDHSTARDRTKEALNCCRILTRILPIILEGDHDATCNVQADGGSDQNAALESDEFEQKLFWSRLLDDDAEVAQLWKEVSTGAKGNANSDRSEDADESQENQFVIEESSDDEEENGDESAVSDPLRKARPAAKVEDHFTSEIKSIPPLGERLLKVLVDLLFYGGFCIPWTEEQLNLPANSPVAKSRIQFVISEKGIGSSIDIPGRTKAHDSHRLELLRLLLVFLSKSIYVSPGQQLQSENKPLRLLVTSFDRSTVLPLLCTLLNVSVAGVKNENWLGSLASLPAGLVKDRMTGEDVGQATMTIALQLLNIILGYESPLQKEEAEQAIRSGTATPAKLGGTPRPELISRISQLSISSFRTRETQSNTFRVYLSKLHRQSDFHLLADGIFAIISQRPSPAALLNSSSNSQMTDTSKAGPHIPETILLLWRLLWHNTKFRTFLLEDRSPQLMSHLLFHALNNKDSAARQGLVRLVVFILHDISCDRVFAVNICKAGSGSKSRITGSQRWGVAVGGGSTVAAGGTTGSQSAQSSTGADILIQSIYALIATTKSGLSALYAPMVITLTNISPYFKNLSILSSNRLLALFNSFVNPTFLLADEGNPRVLYYLIEVLNNVIQHGFQRNPNVAYSIIRNHHSIERLANFTLRRGIAEVRRSRRRSGLLGNFVTSPRFEIPPPTPTFPNSDMSTIVQSPSIEKTEEEVPLNTISQRTEGELGNPQNTVTQAPSSEKARGKMRQPSTPLEQQREIGQIKAYSSAIEEDEEDDLVNGFNEEELYIAASMLGRNGFVPTQNWVTSWHKGLPLDVLQLTVVELVPKVEELCGRIGTKSDADEQILALLREQNLESILPNSNNNNNNNNDNSRSDDGNSLLSSPQPRHFRWTPQVSIWVLSYLWGLVYVTSSIPYGLFNGSCARLFQIRIQEKKTHAPNAGSTGSNVNSPALPPSSPSTAHGMDNGLNSSNSAVNNGGVVAGVGNTVFGSLTSVFGLGISQPRANTNATSSSPSQTGGGSV